MWSFNRENADDKGIPVGSVKPRATDVPNRSSSTANLAKARTTLNESETMLKKALERKDKNEIENAKKKIEEAQALLTTIPAPAEEPGPFSRLVTFMGIETGADPYSEPLIDKEEDKKEIDIVCAAWIIEDALDGHCADDYPTGLEAKEMRHRIHRLFYMKKLIFYISLLLVVMLFAEVPSWCQPTHSSQDTKWAAVDYCPRNDADGQPLTGAAYKDVVFSHFVLPPKYGMITEAVCMVILTLIFLFEFNLSRDLGPSRRLPNCMPGRFLIIMLFMWADLIIYCYYWDKGSFSPFRFAPYGRLSLLFYGQRVRDVFSSTLNCLDEFGSVCIFLMGSVVFFAWMMYNVLDDLHDANGGTPGEVSGDPNNFGSFGQTLVTFFTIMTGAAFPDEIALVLKKNHWYALIFYPFMGISFFLFTQLMLAIVYNAYSGETEERLKNFYIQRSKGLAKTFAIMAVEKLDGDKVIKVDTFSELVAVLSRWPRFKGRLRKQDSEVLFEALDDDGSGELSMDEFFDACSTLQYTIWSTNEKSKLVRHSKKTLIGKLDRFVTNGSMNMCTEAVLIANAIFIGVQSYYDFNDMDEPKGFKECEFFFSVIYMLEVALKLLVYSFPMYWAHMTNRFDFLVSWVLFVGGILDFFQIRTGLPIDGVLDQVMQYFNILRILRLLRLLTQVPSLRKMCTCIGKFCQVSGDMVILFFVSTVFLAILGVQVFGGLMYPNAPNLDANGDYVGTDFDVLNFNDMTGAFLSLLDMQVGAYQPEYAMAMDQVLPITIPFMNFTFKHIGEFYCGAVFFLSVNIAFNIFTAFLIDIFVSLEEAEEEGEETEEDKNLESMKQKFKEKGEYLHFLEPPEVLRLRTLTGVIDGLDEAIQEAQDEALGKSKDDDEEEDAEDEEEPQQEEPLISAGISSASSFFRTTTSDGAASTATTATTLAALAKTTLSFREEKYIKTLLSKLKKESITKPEDLLVCSKEAIEEKLSSHDNFQFVEMADVVRLREAAEKVM